MTMQDAPAAGKPAQITLSATSIQRLNGKSVLTGPVSIELGYGATGLVIELQRTGVCISVPGGFEDHVMSFDPSTVRLDSADHRVWKLSDAEGRTLTIRCRRKRLAAVNQSALRGEVSWADGPSFTLPPHSFVLLRANRAATVRVGSHTTRVPAGSDVSVLICGSGGIDGRAADAELSTALREASPS